MNISLDLGKHQCSWWKPNAHTLGIYVGRANSMMLYAFASDIRNIWIIFYQLLHNTTFVFCLFSPFLACKRSSAVDYVIKAHRTLEMIICVCMGARCRCWWPHAHHTQLWMRRGALCGCPNRKLKSYGRYLCNIHTNDTQRQNVQQKIAAHASTRKHRAIDKIPATNLITTVCWMGEHCGSAASHNITAQL